MFTKKIHMKFLILLFLPSFTFAQNVKFNPEAPLYIEYKSGSATPATDVSLQIEDAKSPSKIRLSLQPKPETLSTYYGYLWLQLGKKVTDEVAFKKSKNNLYGWLTEQDGIQAVFLFDDEKQVQDFKTKALASKKPLTDKKNLPQLMNPTATVVVPVPPATSKSIEVAADMAEVTKFGQLMNAYNAFTPAQKKLNDQKAAELSQAALKQYQLKNYQVAENMFGESLKLNPTNGMSRYYQGICLYQTKKYDRSLALLSLAEGADYNYAEYKYYTGLNYLKIKNYTKATENLEDAKDEKDPDYSPPAAFFAGHIYFQKEDYTQARQNFEFTIDQSKDPKMDREAEAMLEKIDQIEGFKNQMSERFHYTLYVGLGYDSNVINLSTENQATNVSAYRLSYGANFNYKFLYTMKQDLSIDLNASDMYSVNDKFKSDATVQATDPLVMSVGLPYHYRFQNGQRLFTWGFLPSYQTLNMSAETTQRKKILDSTILGTDLYWAVSETYFSRVYLEYAMEKSSLTIATPADDMSAKKMSILTTQTFVTEAALKKMWLADVGYVINNADGDNFKYNKIALGLTYSRLGFWEAINSARLDLTSAKYGSTSPVRTDTVGTLTLGVTKELNKKLNLTLNGLYTTSQSNFDLYKYNKFAVQSVLAYSGGF